MDELVVLVAERAEITPEQAQIAVETVLQAMAEKLPQPLGERVVAFLAGETPAEQLTELLQGSMQGGLEKGMELLGTLLKR